MCVYGESIYYDGKLECIQQGMIENLLISVKTITKKMGVSSSEAMDLLDVSDEDRALKKTL